MTHICLLGNWLCFNKEDIGVLLKIKGKYVTFHVKIKIELCDGAYKNVQLRFIDSLRFMQSSLDGLSSNLVDSLKEKFYSMLNMENKSDADYEHSRMSGGLWVFLVWASITMYILRQMSFVG